MPAIPTVNVKHGDGFMVINGSDFDKDKHELFEAPEGDDVERDEAIRTAISSLSEEDFTKDGKPEVDAINLLLGDDHDTVTAAQRDRVWGEMEADKGQE